MKLKKDIENKQKKLEKSKNLSNNDDSNKNRRSIDEID